MKRGIIIIILLLPISILSQSEILDQYIKEALKENLSIKATELSIAKQKSRAEQARKLWNPNIDLSASYLLAQGGRNLVFPIGDLFNPTYATLNQLTGTENFPTDLENEKIQLTPNNFFDAQLSISKPLINSTIKYNQLIQQELVNLNGVDVKLTEQDITYQVKTAYYNYLKSIEGINIINENVNLLNEVLEFNKKLIKYDKATIDILSDVEIQIANIKTQGVQLKEQQDMAKALFNLMLNKTLDSEILIDENIVASLNIETRSIAELYKQALSNRVEFERIKIAQNISNLNVERINKSKQPTLGINAGIGLQTEEFNFDNGGPLYTAALGLSWKINDGGLRKKQIDEIKIDQAILNNQNAMLKQKVEIEIVQSYLALQSSLQQIENQKSIIKSAQKSLDIIRTRYENDAALLIELLNAQNQLINGQLSSAVIKYDYLIQKALLDKKLAR